MTKNPVVPHTQKDEPTVDTSGRRLSTGIDGVRYERLQRLEDHRGGLAEVLDVRKPFWDQPVVYAYSFTIRPGRIKGWGMHDLQADRYFSAAGRVRVVLYDGREESPTFGDFSEFHFTEASPGLLYIPPGVWHADQNWGDHDAVMMNFPTEPFNHANPDKYRVDPHSGEIPFDWTLPDG